MRAEVVLYVAVIVLVVLVQIFQSVGTRMAVRLDKRMTPKGKKRGLKEAGKKIKNDRLKSDFNAAWNTINARLGNHERCYVYPRGQFNQSTIDTLNKNGAAVQFIWIWDMLPSYMGSAVGRVNVSGSTDVMKAISTYEYLYKLNCKK